MSGNHSSSIMRKETVQTLVLAILLVILYFLILGYSYNSLVLSAENDIQTATNIVSKSMSSIFESDGNQMNLLADEVSLIGASSNESGIRNRNELVGFLKEESSQYVTFGFCFPDGTIIEADGFTRRTGKYDEYENLTDDSSIFRNAADIRYDNFIRRYRKVINEDGSTAGYLFAVYDYAAILESCYSSEKALNGFHDILFLENGDIAAFTNRTDSLRNYENLGEFLEDHSYRGTFPVTGGGKDNSTENSTYIVNGIKYIISTSQVPGFDGIYIARSMPTSAMFSITGRIIIFMIMSSLLFFFTIALVAYRYYKSLTATSNMLRDIAYSDPLTGFSSYAKFKEDAEQILSSDKSGAFYLSCVNMVGFRYINDTFGYDVGDEVLIGISEEISDLLLDDEIFCRMSGDKFLVLSRRNFSDTEKDRFVYRLADRVSSVGPLAKSHIRLEVQIAVYPITEEDRQKLSVNAFYDRCLATLYTIDHTDTGVAFYDASIYNEQIERKEIESRMHQALADGQFRVYVQPKYRTSNAKLAAGEALIRWVDPERGIIPPVKFIPLFEQNRFVHDIDLFVMEVICRFQRLRLNEGLPVVPISLNISPVEFTMPGFCDAYINIKKKYEIPDRLIELEFTEGIFFENETRFKEIIRIFHDAGFACSMDDFGSGYSSLNILKDLPVDVLKLDKLFFRESGNTSRERSIIRAVVAMARSLNIKTVAEGVETLEVVDFLKLIGCTLIQGYIYSKPLPLTEFEEKLNTESVDTGDKSEFDFDKFEIVPLDMPLTNSMDDTLRKTYAGIIEINAGGNIYHMYYPGESDVKFDAISERGFYTAFYDDLIPKYVHPKDLEAVRASLNPLNLTAHFKKDRDLDLEYRHMRKDGSYSWMKLHIIKVNGGREDSQIYFGYFNVIDDYKEAEENLEVAQNRFSAAYSNFNGAVFELDLPTGKVDVLEKHTDMFRELGDTDEYNDYMDFLVNKLVHEDYRETLLDCCTLEYLRSYFTRRANQNSLVVEVQGKPYVNSKNYLFFRASFSAQADPNRILIAIEDVTKTKKEEGASNLRHHVTDTAFANTFESVCSINLDKDLFSMAVYRDDPDKLADVSDGKYSRYFKAIITSSIAKEDRVNAEQILSPEGLVNFYNDTTTNEFKFTFREKKEPDSDVYEWKEALLATAPREYGQDRIVYVFIRNIEELRATERQLNDCAGKLSVSLSLFDYVYSVSTVTGEVSVIGGSFADSSVSFGEKPDYETLTAKIRNTVIAEQDRASFRRLTYLDELTEHFALNNEMLRRTFASVENENETVEVSVTYEPREQLITFFFRRYGKT